MKKSLSLLTLSLLMIVAMILGVSAMQDSDVGFYARFDSQETVDAYAHEAAYARLAYDANENALRLTTIIPEDGKIFDVNTYFKFGQAYNLSDYPYFRMTYKIPSVGINGKEVSNTQNGSGIHYRPNDSYVYDTFAETPRDTQLKLIKDLTGYAGQTMNNVRTDFPNNAYKGEYFEYYIYDIGLFKTREAAEAYNPGLEYYVYDMTSPDEYTKWTTGSNSTMTYDAELGATVFTHGPAESGADERIQLKDPVSEMWYPVQNYPVYTWCYQSNIGANFFVLDTHKTDTGVNSLTEGVFFHNGYSIVDTADGWKLGYYDASSLVAGLSTIHKHVMDPVNLGATTGEEYVAYKYIAYFKNVEQAAKGVTASPEGLAVIEGAAAATITGVDSTMEYTTDVKGTNYVAVEGDTIEALPGRTYYVRYAATETANASNPTAVAIPNFAKIHVRSIKSAAGVNIDFTVEYDGSDIIVNVPFGTAPRALKLDWYLETSVSSAGRGDALLLVNGDSEDAVSVTAGALVDFSDAADEDGMTLTIRYLEAIYEHINFKIVVEGSEASDEELAQTIVDIVAAGEVDGYDLNGFTDIIDISNALYSALDINSYKNTFGTDISFAVSSFTAPVKGTAADVDGTDGSVTYTITATYGDAVKSVEKTVEIPAQHFRYLWKFNDQEFADKWFYSATNVVKTAGGEIPVVTENGETFARVQLTGANGSGIYLDYTIADAKSIYDGGEYDSFFKAEDYPYTVVYYRSNGNLPKVDSGEGSAHFYFENSVIAKGNHYDYAPVPEGMEPNPDPGSLDLTKHPGGSYLGYRWVRNKGYWNATTPNLPKNTQTWYKTIIANNGGTAGMTYASGGYSEATGTPNYTAGNVKYPWAGDVYSFRIDPLKVDSVTEGTFDIYAIGFYATLEEAQNADFAVIDPFTAEEKAYIDAATLEAVDGSEIIGEDAAFAAAKEAVLALIPEGFAARVSKVSYTAMDAANGTDGAMTVAVTVLKGDQLGDRDIYTVEKTLAITAPDFTLEAALEALNKLSVDEPKNIKTEAAMQAIVLEAIKPVTETYTAYTFDFVDATFVAPVDGVSDGYYSFKIQISDGTDSVVSEEAMIKIIKVAAPFILNFDNEVIVSNARVPVGNYHNGSLVTSLVSIDNGLGLRIDRLSETSEFNVTFNPGQNGIDVVEELGDYSVIAYRYKLSNGDPSKVLQVYYYTDLYENGHAYQQVSTSQDGSDITEQWVTRYFTVRNPGLNATGTCEDTTWGGFLEEIRFDFMRQTGDVGAWAEIDYIGLFISMEQAEEFMANPYKNGSEEGLAQYDELIAALNELDSVLPAVTVAECDLNEDLTISNWLELNNILESYIYSLDLGVDAYYTIGVYDAAHNGTEEKPEANDGYVTFKIAFADGGIMNGYVATTKEFTLPIVAEEYKAPAEGEEIDGVVYAVDEEAATVAITAVVDAESVVVPATVTIDEVEYTVTAIAADAFADATATEIRLPNTITEAVELTGYAGYVFVQPGTATAEAVTGECVKLKGDYDDNGETAVGDVIKVLQDLAGEGVTGFAALACDVANNDVVDVSDVIRLLQWLASSSTVLD